jgi:hypothetical protein
MTSALRFRQAILTAGREQQPSKIEFSFSTCDQCHKNNKARSQDHAETRRKALQLELAHEAEITSLLELTTRIEELVSERITLRGVLLNAFLRPLARLKLVVLKQHRDFQATTPRQEIEIEVKKAEKSNGLYLCDRCQKPIEGTNWEAEDPKPIGEIRYGY